MIVLVQMLGACSGGSSDSGGGAVFSILVEAQLPTRTLAEPGLPFEPITFRVKDPEGQGFSNAKVEFYLVRLVGDDPGIDVLKQAWEKKQVYDKPEEASEIDSNAIESDVKGVIVNPPLFTDAKGEATITVTAPRVFDAKIAVVARVVDDLFQGYGYAVLGTESATAAGGKSRRIIQASTTGGDTEVAGEAFDILLTMYRVTEDGSRAIETSFNDLMTLSLSSDVDVAWWPDNIFPASRQATCKFSGGSCLVTGGQWTIFKAGTVILTVAPTGANAIFGESTIAIEVGVNEPSLLLSSNVNPDVAYAPLCRNVQAPSIDEPCLAIDTDQQNQKLHMMVADVGWNYLYQPKAVVWTFDGIFGAHNLNDLNSEGVQTFKPREVGSGNLLARAVAEGFVATLPIKVAHGLPASYVIDTEHNMTEIAGFDFNLVISAFDQFDNPARTYKGEDTVAIQLLGATASPWGVLPSSSVNETIKFINGKAVTTGKLKITNGDDVPKIRLQGQVGEFLSGDVTVQKGPTTSIVLETLSQGQRVELTEQTLLSTQNLSIFAAGRDDLGNRKDEEIVTFAATGALINTITIAVNDATTINPQINNPVVLGEGTIVATPSNRLIPAVTSPKLTVSSAAASSFSVTTNKGRAFETDEDFKLQITALDPELGVANAYDGPKNLSITSQIKPSWTGEEPTVLNEVVSCEFIDGQCEINQPLKLKKASSPVLINVEDIGGEVVGIFSTSLTASAGIPNAVVIADKSGGPNSQAIPIMSSIEITADETASYALAIVDSAGNYLSDAPSSSSWSGDASIVLPNLSSTTGNTTTFDPVLAGVGQISASSGALQPVSIGITVRHGAYDHLRIVTANNNSEQPGIPFGISATLRDADSNVLTSYNEFVPVTIVVQNAKSGPAVLNNPRLTFNGNNTDEINAGIPAMLNSLPIVSGVVGFSGTVTLYDATEVSPTISISFPAMGDWPAISGVSDIIAIAPGPPDHVQFSYTASDDGSFVCHYAYQSDSRHTCASYNVDNGPRQICAEIHDRAGNYLGTSVGNWTANLASIRDDMTGTSGTTCVTLGNETSTYPLSGSVTFTPTDGVGFTETARFQIVPGAVDHFSVSTITTDNGNVKADEDYALEISLRDQFENISGYQETRSVTFAFQGGTVNPSPKGTSPVISPDYPNYNFELGVLRTASVFRTPNSDDSPILNVGVTGLATVPLAIDVASGAAVDVRLLSSLTDGATDYTDAPISMRADDRLSFFAILRDSEQNKIGPTNGSWAGTGVLGGCGSCLSHTAGNSTTELNPVLVGTGGLTFTNGVQSAVSTGTVTVTHGDLSRFAIDTTNVTEQAGVATGLEIIAVDFDSNPVLDFTGSKALAFTIYNNTANPEGRSNTTLTDANYTFSQGALTSVIPITFFNSSQTPYIRVEHRHTDNINYSGWSGSITVSPGTAHHYGVSGPEVIAAKQADSDPFSATISLRDVWGNPLNQGDSDVMLSIVTAAGGAASGTLKGSLGPLNLSGGPVTVDDLTYNVGGFHRLVASGDMEVSAVLEANSAIEFETSPETVDHYVLSVNSPQTAGQNFQIAVVAKDIAGNTVLGADSELSSLTFTWGGVGTALDATTPVLPTDLTFTGGIAYTQVTMYLAQTIGAGTLTISDNQFAINGSFNRSGQSSIALTINPGPIADYDIDASETARLAQSNSLFNVTVRAYDAYENPRAGDGNLTLIPVRVSGHPSTGQFGGAVTTGINVGSGSAVITGIHYNVGHTIKFDVTGGSATASTSDQIAFTETIHSVHHYEVSVPASSTAGNNNVAISVVAKDAANNTVVGVDGDLSSPSQVYVWSGAGTSPDAFAPIYDTDLAFSDGVATATVSFFDAESVGTGSLSVRDGYTGISGGNRSGSNHDPYQVGPAAATNYRVTSPSGLSHVAGVGFNITVKAHDQFGNVDTNYGSDTLTFSWSGTTATTTGSSSPKNPDVLSPASRSFVSGVYATTGNAFILYNENDGSPQLNLSGAYSVSLSGFSVSHESAVDYVQVLNGATSASSEVGALTLTADQTVTIYAHSYDQWGNYIGLDSTVDWSATSVLDGNLSATAASSTSTLSPTTVGSGIITATPAVGSSDSTGLITITPGVAASLAVSMTATSPLTAGDDFGVTLTAKDADGNTATGYTGSKSLTWSWHDAQSSPAPASVPPKKLSNGARTFGSGVFTSGAEDFGLYADAISAAYLSVTDGSISGSSDTLAVDPDAAAKYVLTASSLSQIAGIGFNVTVTARDAYDNVDTNYTSDTLTFSWNGTTATTNGSSSPQSSSVLSSGVRTFSQGVFTTLGEAFALYNESDASPRLDLSGAFSTSLTGFSVSNATSVDYIKILNANSSAGIEVDTLALTADQTVALYAHSYDRWGNHIGPDATVDWSATSVLDGNLSATTNSSTTTLNPTLVGSGVVTATPAVGDGDSTGTITISSGVAASFLVTLTSGSPITAGDDFGVTVTAKDADGNTATSYEGEKNLTWTWNGVQNSPAPANTPPKKLGNGNQTFTAGVFTSGATDFGLYADAISAAYLRVVQGGVSGDSINIAVSPAAASKYDLTVNNLAQTAGVGFDVTVTARDAYDNVDTNYASDTLSFNWSGTTSTSSGSDSPKSAAVFGTGLRNFTDGVFTTSGSAFILYNAGDGTPQLDLTGAFSSALSGFSVNSAATVDYVKIQDGPTSAAAEIGAAALTADESLIMYAHAYDQWGNHIGLDATVDWSATGVLGGNLSATADTATTTASPVTVGDGTVTATPATGVADTTGTISVTHGNVASFVLALTASSPITAGEDFGVSVTAKDADGNTVTNYSGNKSLTWTWGGAQDSPAPASVPPKKVADGDRGFVNGVYSSGATDFGLYAAQISAAQLSVSDGSVSGTSVEVAVAPTTAASLAAEAIPAKQAAESFTATVYVLDAYSNQTNVGCTGELTVTGGDTSSGAPWGVETVPSLPTNVSQNATGRYTTGNIVLYSASTNTLSFDACSLGTATVDVAVTPAIVDRIFMSETDSKPNSHAGTISCVKGTTVTCPTLYAFAFDAFGNEVDAGSYSCPAFTFIDASTNDPDPSLSASSGHSTQASSSTWHINGAVRCTSGDVFAETTATGVIQKSHSWSCGNWACNTTTPSAVCSVNNDTGYEAIAYSFGGEGAGTSYSDTTACDGGLVAGGSCQVVVAGTTGSASGSLTSHATPANAGIVEMLDPATATIQGGSVAPNCTADLSTAITLDWACLAGSGRYTISVTNDNGVNDASFGAGDPSFNPANGAVLVSTSCKSVTLSPGQSCTAIVEHGAGAAATLEFSPTDDFFQMVSISNGMAPNCTQTASVAVAVQTGCAGVEPKTKTLRVTLTNNNTLEDMSFPASAVTANDAGSIVNDNCSNQTLLKGGGSCTFDIEYADAPTVNNLDVAVSESSDYFNDIAIGMSDGDNHCD